MSATLGLGLVAPVGAAPRAVEVDPGTRAEPYDHFAAEARLIGFVGSNAENLADSIAGEEQKATVTYPAFAEQARRDGCPEIAEHRPP
ncbi:hypothetical protein V6U90_03500 [Micromonospora sp. CPCC 206060]|uniref:hypothetical protein n=1 Tax=Micromonospora sp. CPCC 206060 TaxID=3122406 RepID=UPI002FEF9024